MVIDFTRAANNLRKPIYLSYIDDKITSFVNRHPVAFMSFYTVAAFEQQYPEIYTAGKDNDLAWEYLQKYGVAFVKSKLIYPSITMDEAVTAIVITELFVNCFGLLPRYIDDTQLLAVSVMCDTKLKSIADVLHSIEKEAGKHPLEKPKTTILSFPKTKTTMNALDKFYVMQWNYLYEIIKTNQEKRNEHC